MGDDLDITPAMDMEDIGSPGPPLFECVVRYKGKKIHRETGSAKKATRQKAAREALSWISVQDFAGNQEVSALASVMSKIHAGSSNNKPKDAYEISCPVISVSGTIGGHTRPSRDTDALTYHTDIETLEDNEVELGTTIPPFARTAVEEEFVDLTEKEGKERVKRILAMEEEPSDARQRNNHSEDPHAWVSSPSYTNPPATDRQPEPAEYKPGMGWEDQPPQRQSEEVKSDDHYRSQNQSGRMGGQTDAMNIYGISPQNSQYNQLGPNPEHPDPHGQDSDQDFV